MPTDLRKTVLSIIATALFATSLHAESLNRNAWLQWRGPDRNGQVTSSPWPADLSEQHLTEKWSIPQGPGYSGPIVMDDRVFVTETKDKKLEVVRALDRTTGKKIWATQWEGSISVPFFAAANGSWIRATPVSDGERLYVAGIRDVLVCLDASNGEILWKRDFVADTGSPLPKFGFASSPLLHGDHIYVQAGAGFAKLDKLTGAIVWQTLHDGGGMNGSAFSSPVFAEIADVPQLVVQTRNKLAGVSPEDGRELWSREITAFRGMNILTPTIIGDTIFTSSYGGRSTLLRVTRDGSTWIVAEAWNHKSQGYMSSPVVVDGSIYLHLRNQRFVCLDAKTGKEHWTTKPFGKYWSLVANEDKLLALDESGELLLIDASADEFKLIDKRSIGDNTWAHIAILKDAIYVRHLDAMTVYTWR